MISKITGGATERIFSSVILNKYEVDFFKCLETGFIQTEDPYWLEEAYSSAITKLDVGLASRNEALRSKTIKVINEYFDSSKKFLDYAGGYGLFTRMMRDQGFDFFHTDRYCTNIFANYFTLADSGSDQFELITSFESFEHFANPLEEISLILRHGDNLLFTTELQPKQLNCVTDWWYFIPETGQHISFYTIESLQYLANSFGLNFYTDGRSLHLFTKKSLPANLFEREVVYPWHISVMKRKIDRFMRKASDTKTSLLQNDWQKIKDSLS
ncbi:class I SAM-dependent methyltransferase [Pedobacter sp. G11]|uniref:class I SAM-dependent methyltransferase n=1 Tax=Pedobacter sp. G11 TaxID=2482728 RepID=UPI000F5ED7B6|nr:class I SAM-dependent methyltransferase [Pedobacter sp. G11]AZI25271.1 class I SAM-dependent methyltransferase [Pedobacter sp. G11]